jgi:SH3-like domain-containing protein
MKILSGIVGLLTLIAVLAAGPMPAAAERLAVTAPLANIRGGPGTEYDVLWQVERYFPLEVIDRSGPWIFFRDFEGDRGWVHRSLVGDLPAAVTTSPTSNVRSGPGTDYDIRMQVDFGVPFRVLERKGEWLHVEHADGEKGWIHQSLIW